MDNATITERFQELTSQGVSGSHTSAIKVTEEADEFFRMVIRPFLKAREPSGAGLDPDPKRLEFVLPDVRPCAHLSVKNVDRVPIHWGVAHRPHGYAVSIRANRVTPGEVERNPVRAGLV